MSNTTRWLNEVFCSFIALVSGAEHELEYYTDPSPWTIETVAAYWHQLWEGRK